MERKGNEGVLSAVSRLFVRVNVGGGNSYSCGRKDLIVLEVRVIFAE
jgi:hypothetical protein